MPLRDVFSDFDREPLGSGSVAQVHRARLHGEADFVAVKVRHPDVVRSMRTDFVILARLGEFLDSFPSLQWLGVPESLRTFAHAVASQVRLDIEAANLARFRRNFRASPHISASFPCPRPKLVSRAVLVESFEPGRSISACVEVLHVAQRLARRQAEAAPDELSAAAAEQWDLDDDRPIAAELPLSAKARPLRAPPPLATATSLSLSSPPLSFSSPPRLASRRLGSARLLAAKPPALPPLRNRTPQAARHVVETGKEVYLQMLLVHNFVHADLHPGNIFLREEPGRPPTLVLVDAGMVDVLSEREQDNFVGLFRAMGKGDGREAARRLLGFSDSQPGGPESHAAFADEMEGIFGRSCRGFRTGVDIGSVLGEILASLRKHQARPSHHPLPCATWRQRSPVPHPFAPNGSPIPACAVPRSGEGRRAVRDGDGEPALHRVVREQARPGVQPPGRQRGPAAGPRGARAADAGVGAADALAGPGGARARRAFAFFLCRGSRSSASVLEACCAPPLTRSSFSSTAQAYRTGRDFMFWKVPYFLEQKQQQAI